MIQATKESIRKGALFCYVYHCVYITVHYSLLTDDLILSHSEKKTSIMVLERR